MIQRDMVFLFIALWVVTGSEESSKGIVKPCSKTYQSSAGIPMRCSTACSLGSFKEARSFCQSVCPDCAKCMFGTRGFTTSPTPSTLAQSGVSTTPSILIPNSSTEAAVVSEVSTQELNTSGSSTGRYPYVVENNGASTDHIRPTNSSYTLGEILDDSECGENLVQDEIVVQNEIVDRILFIIGWLLLGVMFILFVAFIAYKCVSYYNRKSRSGYSHVPV